MDKTKINISFWSWREREEKKKEEEEEEEDHMYGYMSWVVWNLSISMDTCLVLYGSLVLV